jgi:pSer/pThr/pTyr-binding forkhead associated (FHA) protein
MAACLTIYPPDRPVRSYLLDPRNEYRLGRGEACELRIPDHRVSRTHARIARKGCDWQVVDLGSKNGTQVDGRDCRESGLTDGSWISFGGLLANFRLLSADALDADRRRGQARWGSTVDLSRRLQPAAGIERLLGEVLDALVELAGAERGFVMLPDEEGRLAVRARVNRSAWAAGQDDFSGSLGAVQQVLDSRQPVVACDVRADVLLARRPSVQAGGIRALVCMPLLIGERISGVIYLDSRLDGKVFTELDLEILEAFASHAALVLGVASVRDDIADLAALLPREMSRRPGAEELVRRLQAILPAHAALADPGGTFA